MTDTPLAQVRGFFDSMDAGDWEGVHARLHPQHRFHVPGAAEPLDRDAHIGFTRGFVAAFPDFRHRIDEQFAAGDQVVTRGAILLTHRGVFQGIPPTGAAIAMDFINIARLQDGLNREEWVQMDMVSLLAAIGALPRPG